MGSAGRDKKQRAQSLINAFHAGKLVVIDGMRFYTVVTLLLTSANIAVAQVEVDAATASINPDRIFQHVRALASDEFEGRAPGTPGEEKTIQYLVDQFKKAGLVPGNPDGTYIQKVPLRGITCEPTISFNAGGKNLELALPKDCVVWTKIPEKSIKVPPTEIVFVGYGIQAPEYQWDDFKGVDVKGKTILMLINDPPVPDSKDPSRLDEKAFKGKAMTYYGRWTYKYEMASKLGAAAALIVHETGPAGYPWTVVIGSNTRENLSIADEAGKRVQRVAVEGWIALETAKRLLTATGQSFEDLKTKAAKRDFQPVTLKATASFELKNTLREFSSRNVVAKIKGSTSSQEHIVYTSHWDHLGKNDKLEGDQIFNGAFDNASGTAALLELARAFNQLKPSKDVIFLAVTAEEKGLLGAKYYASHPLYPISATLANINMDGVNVWGRTRDVGLVGVGQSSLEDLLQKFVRAQKRQLVAESEPEKGYYFRSDHFEFAKVGVPALYLDEGTDYVGQPADFGKQKRIEYTANDYHKVTDEIKPGWNFEGAAEDLKLLLQVGWEVSEGKTRPTWKAGSEFKNIRR